MRILVSNDDGYSAPGLEALVAALDHWLGGAPRPQRVPPPGSDSADRYLALLDSLMPA